MIVETLSHFHVVTEIYFRNVTIFSFLTDMNLGSRSFIRLSLSVIKVAVDTISRIEIMINVYEANGGERTNIRTFIGVYKLPNLYLVP